MTILSILRYPDPRLKTIAKEITEFNGNLRNLAEDMAETMYKAGGIGLAATQVNVHRQIFVVDVSSDKNKLQIYINPKIIEKRGTIEFEEGCLSIPNIREKINRKTDIEVTYFDENWNQFTENFNGMRARVIQHEYDHIEGKLFTDYLPSLKRKLLANKLKEISKGKCDVSYQVKSSR